MFTGLIETLGSVTGLARAGEGSRLRVAPRAPLAELAVGESIAVSGVCLTAEQGSRGGELIFFLSTETLARTTLGRLERGALVNLERSLRADGRLGGHLVMGHVDGIGAIRRFDRLGEGWVLEIAFPPDLAPYLAVKGSVAVDGISLTVADLREGAFTVAVIPHTAQATNLCQARAGSPVNLEVDVLARHVVRALDLYARQSEGVTREKLRQAGF